MLNIGHHALRKTSLIGDAADLGNGDVILTQSVVLATGHLLSQIWDAPFSNPWLERPLEDPDAAVCCWAPA